MEQKAVKEKAAQAAVDALVKSGMKLGLGTGSTACHAVRYVGKLLEEGKLKNIMAVPTSFQTVIECENSGVPLFTLNSREIGGSLDLAIDGADEVDPLNRCIKGGGGALLLEKIVEYSSGIFAVVVDESKIVGSLGTKFRIPVEVIPDARLAVSLRLEKLGADVKLRDAVAKAGPVITDRGNVILDILFREAVEPVSMEAEINHIPGVVENGLFVWPPSELAGGPSRPHVFIGLQAGGVERRD